MAEPKPESRPYHHGDLRRALVEAARRLLETEGPAALSLRAVAREAGVSPAAPYHHFKDKRELLNAVAEEGWSAMGLAVTDAIAEVDGEERLLQTVLTYVRFAREQPALYQVMYESMREGETVPLSERLRTEGTVYDRLRQALAAAPGQSELDVGLSMVAAWCAAHGLSEMAGFKTFEPLKRRLGGELPFLDAVLRHMGLYRPIA
jgi:AcrR family transcriptional regulator